MALGLIVGMTLAGASVATAAYATDPGQLGSSGYVDDDVDVLTPAQEQEVNERLEKLRDETGAELFVVYVDQFTNPSDRIDWANETFEASGLGPQQYLLAIATEGRQMYIAAAEDNLLSDDELTSAEDAARLALNEDDWAGAPVAAADDITESKGGGSSSSSSGSSSSGSGFTWVLLAIAGIVAIVLLVMFLQRKKKTRQIQHDKEASLAELERAAGSALVQTDDAIKTSTDELGFAKAQFGDEATAEYESTLAEAKKALDGAFAIKQQLDDEVPDTEEQKVAWNKQIIELLTNANAMLDEKADKFDELRKLEQNAPEALAAVTKVRDERVAAQPAAEATWADLQSKYAAASLKTVENNVEESRLRIQFANEQISRANQSIAVSDNAPAAVAIRAAEEAMTQIAQLQTALATMSTDLASAGDRSAALIAELQQDIATAQGLQDPDGRVAQVVAATQGQIANAQAALSQTPANPLVAVQALEAANTSIDGVVNEVRDAMARAEKAKRQLGDSIMNAQAKVSAAEDFITTRRGAVGATARTRLAEAGASLTRARELQSADPERALSEAQRATQLADAAINAAQEDVGAFNQSGFGGGGNDVMSAVLGGVILNSVLGGGRNSGGGGMFGGGGGLGGMLGGGRGGGGGFSTGSFGGGGTRSRRGGGRF